MQHRGAARGPRPRLRSVSSSGTVDVRARAAGPGRRRRSGAVDVGLHAAAGQRPEVAGRGRAARASAAAATIARASGCSLSASTAPASRSTSSSVVPAGGGDAGDGVRALGQGAGLVEQHRVDGAHPLQREPVLDQDAGPRRHRGGQRDHQRDGQAEGVRAGDHQDRDGAHDGLVEVAERPPRDEGDQRGGGGDVEQHRGEPVGEHLGPAAGLPAPARRAARCRPARCPRRPRRPAPAAPSRWRPCRRPPGRRRPRGTGRDSPVIIDSSSSAAPSTIRPSAGTRAPERTSTTSPTRRSADRHPLDRAVVGDPLGVVGQQRGQRGERALGLADRLHLLPVAEQHDGDQRGQLPPEVQVEPAEAGGQRRDVGDGDRHRDQQHHPGRPVAHLPDAADEERPAAVEEHDRAEHRPDPATCRGSPGE